MSLEFGAAIVFGIGFAVATIISRVAAEVAERVKTTIIDEFEDEVDGRVAYDMETHITDDGDVEGVTLHAAMFDIETYPGYVSMGDPKPEDDRPSVVVNSSE